MKVTLKQADLVTHLGLVNKAVASRSQSQPILGHVLVEAIEATEGNFVQLTGYDCDLGIVTRFGAVIEEAGSVTLPAKLFTDIVGKLPNSEISLLQDNGDEAITSVVIKCGISSYQIQGMAASNYPELPELPDKTLLVDRERFLAGIKMTLFAAATDEGKQILTGVHLKTTKNGLEFATTDGHRLAMVASETDLEAGLDLTIPGRTFRELERLLLSSSAGEFRVHFNEGSVVFMLPQQMLYSRLLDGTYPNYNNLLPKTFVRFYILDRKALIASLERIAVLASQKNNVIRLSFTVAELSITVDAPDVGAGREVVACTPSGEDFEVGFNVKYMLDPLKVMDGDNVKMSFNGSSHPAIIDYSDATTTNFRYLIMPVQIRS